MAFFRGTSHGIHYRACHEEPRGISHVTHHEIKYTMGYAMGYSMGHAVGYSMGHAMDPSSSIVCVIECPMAYTMEGFFPRRIPWGTPWKVMAHPMYIPWGRGASRGLSHGTFNGGVTPTGPTVPCPMAYTTLMSNSMVCPWGKIRGASHGAPYDTSHRVPIILYEYRWMTNGWVWTMRCSMGDHATTPWDVP